MMKKRLINVLLLSILSFSSKAQTEGYHFYSILDSVKTSGFYNIVLAPHVNSHVKTDYSDVRVIDSKNKWVPHVLHIPINELSREVVIFDLKFAIAKSDKINTIIIISAEQQLNNINLVIQNSAVEKFGTLSGSNDKQNWFVISDSILLNPPATEKNSESILNIKFPQSNYSNLKLVINNRNKDPFNIISVSTNEIDKGFLFSNFSDSVLQNPTGIFFQKDSARQSLIKIIQANKFHFNQIIIKVEGSKYYNREVELYVADLSKSNFSNPGKFVQAFTISNNSSLKLNLPLQNANVFYLIIKNEDNPALRIKEVTTGISYRYITAFLEKNNSYKLMMDNTNALFPSYDITNDYPTLKDPVSQLGIGNIIAYKLADVKKDNSSKNNKWIIWSAIIATLCILLFFTKTMIKEVNKKINS